MERGNTWKEQFERGPTFARAIYPHHATHFMHRSCDDREAEAAASPRFLGRVERLEDLLAIRLRHTRAGIRHEQQCAGLPGGEFNPGRPPLRDAWIARVAGIIRAFGEHLSGLVSPTPRADNDVSV